MLYVYRDGVYRPDGEMLIRRRVKHLLLDYDCTEMWSRALAGEIVEFIALDVPELPERPSTGADQPGKWIAKRQDPAALPALTRPLVHNSHSQSHSIHRPVAWRSTGSLARSSRRTRFRSPGRSSAIS